MMMPLSCDNPLISVQYSERELEELNAAFSFGGCIINDAGKNSF